jgi:hypothetical protein
MFILLVVSLLACQRSTGFLEVVPDPKVPHAGPLPTESPGPPPIHASKVYQLIDDVVGEITPPVDILWVIDNSNSMQDKQNAVIQNTAQFMKNFTQNTKLKWKMGLLSTTLGANPYVGFTPQTLLNNQTPNPVKVFQDAVNQLGVNGDGNEESFGPILNNLRKYPNFLTPDAFLAIVVVTDEEEQTWDGNFGPYLTINKFVNQLLQIKGSDISTVPTYGVFASKENCYNGNFWYGGSRWDEFMNFTNGKTYSACDPDFGKVLSNLGADLVKKILAPHPIILLGVQPIPSSIQVFYRGRKLKPGFKDQGGEWIYDSKYNYIQITDPSILSSTVKSITVEFDFQPDS